MCGGAGKGIGKRKDSYHPLDLIERDESFESNFHFFVWQQIEIKQYIEITKRHIKHCAPTRRISA
jgi:hypothetical protein